MKCYYPKNEEEYLKVQTDRQPWYVLEGGEMQLAPWHETIFNEFRPYLGSPHLDIGVRDGLILDKLQEIDIEAYGVELTNAAKSGQAKNRKIIQCDAQKGLPFNDKFFKSVSILHVLEHMFDPNKVLQEIKRVLDGYLLVICPERMETPITIEQFGHYSEFHGLQDLIDTIKNNGFEIVKTYGVEVKGPHCLTVIAKPI